MKVLHVSARLSEGGAAQVARSIADTLGSYGDEHKFLYGYSSRGRPSPMDSEYSATRLGNLATAGIQLVAHRLLGAELPVYRGGGHSALERDVISADILHIHIAHSYFLHLDSFVDLIVRNRSRVVWTLHDQWVFTGRCAQPNGCQLWKTGCRRCPDRAAYPPALVDRAASVFEARKRSLSRMVENTSVRWVACAEWLAAEFDSVGLGNAKTIHNSVDAAIWSASHGERSIHGGAKTRVTFAVRDLRDGKKVDWDLLRRIAAMSEVELTIVGDNAPDVVEGAISRPAIRDRDEYAQMISSTDIVLFCSAVDYNPLTIAESLAMGRSVVALDSAAAREFVGHGDIRLYQNNLEAQQLVRAWRPSDDKGKNLYFSPERMALEYRTLYEELLQ
jgi:putative colanic acid biosynthesis glycosyltransferase